MKKIGLAFLMCLSIMTGCDNGATEDNSGADSVTTNNSADTLGNTATPPPSAYKIIPKNIAWEMMHLYRDKKVKIKDGVGSANEDKSNVAAHFTDPGIKAEIAAANEISIISAAYKEDHASKKLRPTLLLRLVKQTAALGVDTSYYLPVRETLCPPPDDCN